jgi:hypothetical protein
MSKIVQFPKTTVSLTRLYCDDCGIGLSYWVGDDDNAYGLCSRCDLQQPDEIVLGTEETEH